jgi:hypothetical protein
MKDRTRPEVITEPSDKKIEKSTNHQPLGVINSSDSPLSPRLKGRRKEATVTGTAARARQLEPELTFYALEF